MKGATATRLHTMPDEASSPPASLRPRYPRMTAYLDALPAGLRSYPECRARSGILQTFLEAMPRRQGPTEPFVEQLLRPPARAWVPEAALNAALLAIADAEGMTDASFLEWNRATNRELYRGLLYRALMAIFSPAQLLERAPSRWQSFHAGTSLTVRVLGPHEAVAELSYPEGLFAPLLLHVYAGAFTAALEHARAREATVELAKVEAARAQFSARWR